MKILSIETSCDETAVSIIEASGDATKPTFSVLSNLVLSQIKIHEKYGGVFPNLAKREHSKNLGPLILKALEEAGLAVPFAFEHKKKKLGAELQAKIQIDLSREPELFKNLADLFESIEKPQIDLIAVTFGPGLEPALWVGINAAKTLGEVWGIPVMPVNHMEGHISSVLLDVKEPVEFPVLALLISGGHTEIVLMSDWLNYKVIGQTRDDAVGEAFDKVARMLKLPYPGGPEISRLAEQARENSRNTKTAQKKRFNFPRPMIKSGDLDFSFSGLKTSVLYALGALKEDEITEEIKSEAAMEFEDAVIETLVSKIRQAIDEHAPKTLIIAGGVIANKAIRRSFEAMVGSVGSAGLENQSAEFPDMKLLIPTHALATDNALMIALAAYVRFLKGDRDGKSGKSNLAEMKAEGNVQLG